MMDNWLRPQPLHRTAASREMVLSTDQVVAPNIETKPIDLNLRRMQETNDMSVRPARGK